MYIKVSLDDGQANASGALNGAFGSAERKRGPWARWTWDGSRLQAEVDRYGFYPLFYAVFPDGVALSESIAELLSLGASSDFDDAAMAAFLRLGFFLGEDTPFRAIRAFPVGGRLSWNTANGLTVEGKPIPRVLDTTISRAAAVDGYVERFRNAIEQSLPPDPRLSVLPISGGRDSRHIAFELKRLGFQPGMLITQRHFPTRSDEDAELAIRVCDELGWPLVIEAQRSDPVASEIEKNRRFDCLSDEHAWFLPTAERIRASSARFAFDGLAGDVLSKGFFVRDYWIKMGRAGRFIEAFETMPRMGYGASEAALVELLVPVYAKRWSLELAHERMLREISKHTYDDDPVNQFFIWNRTRREVAPFLIRHLSGLEVLTPFLDDEVFNFLWSLPTDFLVDHLFHNEALAKAAPEHAHIPVDSGTGFSDPEAYHALLLRGMAKRPQFWQRGEILNRQRLRPRLVKALVSNRYARESGWLCPNWAIWLAGVEGLVASNRQTVRMVD